MQSDYTASPKPAGSPEPDDAAARLAASAKGWHGLQMAVLGFIGICGAIREGAGPSWLQWSAAAVILLGLLVAVAAIFLVGRVAYPFYGGPMAMGGTDEVEAGARRLRRGIRLTFVAVAMVAAAAVTGWWPTTEPAAAAAETASVEVRDAAGGRLCGRVAGSTDGTVRLETAGGIVLVRLDRVASIRPVAAC